MSSDDTEYYRKRALAERALAQASGRSDVREIHEELARQYEALVRQAGLRPAVRVVQDPHDEQVAAA